MCKVSSQGVPASVAKRIGLSGGYDGKYGERPPRTSDKPRVQFSTVSISEHVVKGWPIPGCRRGVSRELGDRILQSSRISVDEHEASRPMRRKGDELRTPLRYRTAEVDAVEHKKALQRVQNRYSAAARNSAKAALDSKDASNAEPAGTESNRLKHEREVPAGKDTSIHEQAKARVEGQEREKKPTNGERRVQFSNLSIVELEVQPGFYRSCPKGAALELGDKIVNVSYTSVESYEALRPKRRPRKKLKVSLRLRKLVWSNHIQQAREEHWCAAKRNAAMNTRGRTSKRILHASNCFIPFTLNFTGRRSAYHI